MSPPVESCEPKIPLLKTNNKIGAKSKKAKTDDEIKKIIKIENGLVLTFCDGRKQYTTAVSGVIVKTRLALEVIETWPLVGDRDSLFDDFASQRYRLPPQPQSAALATVDRLLGKGNAP